MKKILIYGDSNAWGDNFYLGKRIDDDKQWPNILQNMLGDKYKVISESLPGRVAGNEELDDQYKNGKDNFLSAFKSQAPVDIVIISLGSNDLQIKYNRDYKDIIKDLLWYEKILTELYQDLEIRVKYFKNEKMPRIIYMMPINFDYSLDSVIFNEECEQNRKSIIEYFDKNNIDSILEDKLPLFEDGIHLNYEGHKMTAKLVFDKINN